MAMKAELHGLSIAPDKHLVCRHEASHLIMFWLMDRIIAGVCAKTGGGMTYQVSQPKELEMQHEHIIGTLAGMVGEANVEVINELYEHIADPSWFRPDTDSYHVASGISMLKGPADRQLVIYIEVVERLLAKFSTARNQVARLLEKEEMLDLKQIYELFTAWDEKYGFTTRPKSDYVCRLIGRFSHWKMPRKGWIGWDFKPLNEWTYNPPSLIEVAMKCKEHFDGLKK